MTRLASDWAEVLESGVELVRSGKRAQDRVEDWFYVQELAMGHREALLAQGLDVHSPTFCAELLHRIVQAEPAGRSIASSRTCRSTYLRARP